MSNSHTNSAPLPQTKLEIGEALFVKIQEELNDTRGVSAGDAIRIFQLSTNFLRDFTHVDKVSKHQILKSTILRILDPSTNVSLPEETRIILVSLVETDVFDALIHGAVTLYNMAADAIRKKFDLDNDGKITPQELQTVCCGPASCCIPRRVAV
jgi:hypothetical protein